MLWHWICWIPSRRWCKALLRRDTGYLLVSGGLKDSGTLQGGISGMALPLGLQFSGVSKERQVDETAEKANTASRSYGQDVVIHATVFRKDPLQTTPAHLLCQTLLPGVSFQDPLATTDKKTYIEFYCAFKEIGRTSPIGLPAIASLSNCGHWYLPRCSADCCLAIRSAQ